MADLSYEDALKIFLITKFLFLIGLFLIWFKLFKNLSSSYLFTIFILLGFNSCIYLDIKHGNISIYEQFFIWLGIYFFIQKKYLFFSLFIIITSLFKILPILLLLIYFSNGFKNNIKKIVYSFIAFLFLQLLLFLIARDYYFSFIEANPSNEIGGSHEPTSYKFFLNVIKSLGGNNFIFMLISLLWFLMITLLTFFNLGKNTENQWAKLFIIIVVYALIVPRMKSYSFILLLPAAYYFITQISNKYWILFLFVIFSENLISKFVPHIFSEYYFFFITFVLWIFGLIVLNRPIYNFDKIKESI